MLESARSSLSWAWRRSHRVQRLRNPLLPLPLPPRLTTSHNLRTPLLSRARRPPATWQPETSIHWLHSKTFTSPPAQHKMYGSIYPITMDRAWTALNIIHMFLSCYVFKLIHAFSLISKAIQLTRISFISAHIQRFKPYTRVVCQETCSQIMDLLPFSHQEIHIIHVLIYLRSGLKISPSSFPHLHYSTSSYRGLRGIIIIATSEKSFFRLGVWLSSPDVSDPVQRDNKWSGTGLKSWM